MTPACGREYLKGEERRQKGGDVSAKSKTNVASGMDDGGDEDNKGALQDASF
jgi:hypothetical protein